MTIQEMTKFIIIDHYITYNSVKVDFNNDSPYNVGFFVQFYDQEELRKLNKWRFIPNNSAREYQETKSIETSIIIDGDTVAKLTLL